MALSTVEAKLKNFLVLWAVLLAGTALAAGAEYAGLYVVHRGTFAYFALFLLYVVTALCGWSLGKSIGFGRIRNAVVLCGYLTLYMAPLSGIYIASETRRFLKNQSPREPRPLDPMP